MNNRFKYYTAIIGLMSTAVPSLADSDTDDIEEIVVTGSLSTFGATKSDIPILETARSIKVIEAGQFLERGALTLDDTLNYTAGVVGDTFGFSTRGDFPRVRGLSVPEYLDNIQVLFGFYNNARSDIYTLEQVEILKGPASVLYGQGSPGGILNTISKKAGRDYLTHEIMADFGTHGRMQGGVDLGFDISGDASLTGRIVSVYRNSGTQIDHVGDNVFAISPSLTFQNETTVLTALANYTNRTGDTSHQFLPLSVTACGSDKVTISEPSVCAGTTKKEVDSSLYVGHPDFNQYDTRSVSVTLFAEQILNDIFSVEATGRYRDSDAEYKQTWVSFPGAGTPRVLPDGTAVGRSWYHAPAASEQFAVDTRIRAKFETGGLYHEVLAGLSYQDVKTSARRAFLPRATTFNLFNPVYNAAEVPDAATFDAARGNRENDVKTTGFYVNYQISFENLIINGGIRYDDLSTGNGTVTQDDNSTSISAGALYKTSFGLNPYFSYAESFQAVVGLDSLTNNTLKPQRGEQIEVGLKYNPHGSKTYITAAYFDIKQSNLPNAAGLPNAPSQQEGVAKFKGFEIEAQTVLGDFYLDGNFSVLTTENPNGFRVSSIPKTQASVWMTWKPSSDQLDGLILGAGVRHVGNNESNGVSFIAANGFAPTRVTVITDGYTAFDALMGYTFNDIDFTLNVRNMFDMEYYGTCLARGDCFPGERRTIVARAAYRF